MSLQYEEADWHICEHFEWSRDAMIFTKKLCKLVFVSIVAFPEEDSFAIQLSQDNEESSNFII